MSSSPGATDSNLAEEPGSVQADAMTATVAEARAEGHTPGDAKDEAKSGSDAALQSHGNAPAPELQENSVKPKPCIPDDTGISQGKGDVVLSRLAAVQKPGAGTVDTPAKVDGDSASSEQWVGSSAELASPPQPGAVAAETGDVPVSGAVGSTSLALDRKNSTDGVAPKCGTTDADVRLDTSGADGAVPEPLSQQDAQVDGSNDQPIEGDAAAALEIGAKENLGHESQDAMSTQVQCVSFSCPSKAETQVYPAIAESFQKRQDSSGCIHGVPKALHRPSEVADVLADAGVTADPHLLNKIVNVVTMDPHAVSLEEMNVIACLLVADSPTTAYLRSHDCLVETMAGPNAHQVGYLAPGVHLSRSQQRYLRSGRLDCKAHPAISRYIRKLDEHRRACEAAKRYREARAARDRLRELRTQQAELVLANVHRRHASELALVRGSLLAQRARHEAECSDRVAQLERHVVSAIEGLRARHAREVRAAGDMERPQSLAPHASVGTLQRRRQEVAMAAVQRYECAGLAKADADTLARGDVAHASAYEAQWRRLRRDQLAAQQRRETQALLARCACQRDDLEKQLVQTLERHNRRCRAVVAELMRVHAREATHLEYIVAGKALAGKCSAVRDATFQRAATVPLL